MIVIPSIIPAVKPASAGKGRSQRRPGIIGGAAAVAALALALAAPFGADAADAYKYDAGSAGCETLLEQNLTIPDRAYWAGIRDAYVNSVGADQSTINWPHAPDDGSDGEESVGASGMVVPFEVRVTPEGDRAIYATVDIPKGESVWVDTYHAIFDEEHRAPFDSFLSSISWEQSCYMLQWCYGHAFDDEDDDEESRYVACFLDERALLNHAEEGVANVGYSPYDDSANMIALRNVSAGEELLQDYRSFHHDLDWLDDLLASAWGQDHWEGDDDDEYSDDEDNDNDELGSEL